MRAFVATQQIFEDLYARLARTMAQHDAAMVDHHATKKAADAARHLPLQLPAGNTGAFPIPSAWFSPVGTPAALCTAIPTTSAATIAATHDDATARSLRFAAAALATRHATPKARDMSNVVTGPMRSARMHASFSVCGLSNLPRVIVVRRPGLCYKRPFHPSRSKIGTLPGARVCRPQAELIHEKTSVNYAPTLLCRFMTS